MLTNLCMVTNLCIVTNLGMLTFSNSLSGIKTLHDDKNCIKKHINSIRLTPDLFITMHLVQMKHFRYSRIYRRYVSRVHIVVKYVMHESVCKELQNKHSATIRIVHIVRKEYTPRYQFRVIKFPEQTDCSQTNLILRS